MNNFSKIRKATQFTSLAASSMIFIIALYGILIHNDSYFEIGLLLFGFIIVGGIFLSPILGRFWWNIYLKKYRKRERSLIYSDQRHSNYSSLQ